MIRRNESGGIYGVGVLDIIVSVLALLLGSSVCVKGCAPIGDVDYVCINDGCCT